MRRMKDSSVLRSSVLKRAFTDLSTITPELFGPDKDKFLWGEIVFGPEDEKGVMTADGRFYVHPAIFRGATFHSWVRIRLCEGDMLHMETCYPGTQNTYLGGYSREQPL